MQSADRSERHAGLTSERVQWEGRLQAMTGQQYSCGTALAHLEELFSGGGRSGRGKGMTIVLADEMDLLVTKKHEVSRCRITAAGLLPAEL